MFQNNRNKRCKSANLMRCRENKLHVVELTLEDVQPAHMSPPAKFETYIKQENCHRSGTEVGEIFIDEVKTLPRYPSENTLNVEGEIYEGRLHSDDILNNQRKSVGNSRYQIKGESDNSRTVLRPYRPISSHQYLTSTELKDAALHDKNVHLGRPTRTTLLRERERRRSVDASRHQQHKAGQKQDPRTQTRYEAVTNILYSMIPPGQSLHSFLSGARYNRSNWIETMGSLDLASDLPAKGGSSLNTQRQRPVSVNFDAEYMPRAPPDSPVDFSSTAVKDGSTGVFLPALSGSGTAEPTSPPTKQIPENRSRKIAWDEEIMRLSPLPDRAASTQEKVRFQTEEPVTGGNVHVAHHERTQHVVRPSSVRAPTSQLAKHGRDMATVVVHGISLHGGSCAPSARDVSVSQAPAEQPSEGMRRSWSATSYMGSGSRPPSMEFSRLDPLKVTGIKVSGATDAGRAGLRLSALKPWRLETDAESTEAMMGSRCEGISDRETVTEAVECPVVESDRSNPNNEDNYEIDSNKEDDHEIDSMEEVDHEIESNREADHQIEPDKEIDHEIKSNKHADYGIEPNQEVDHQIESNREADDQIKPDKELDRELDSNIEADHEIDSKKEADYEIDQGTFEKQGQVNLPNESMEQGNIRLSEEGQVSVDDVFEEPDQGSTNDQSAEQGHVITGDESTELGQVSVLNESAEEAEFLEDSDNLGQVSQPNDRQNDDDEKNEEDVVFFITEEESNHREKVDGGCRDDRVKEDEGEDDSEEEEEEQLSSYGTAKEMVNETNFDEDRSAEYLDIVVSERSAVSPDGETTEAGGRGGQSVAKTNQSLDGHRK